VPAQYDLLNQIKQTYRISLGEVSRKMFDIAICVLLYDFENTRNRAEAFNHVSPETIQEYANEHLQ